MNQPSLFDHFHLLSVIYLAKNRKGEVEVAVEVPTNHMHAKGEHQNHHHLHVAESLPPNAGAGLGERYYATPLLLGPAPPSGPDRPPKHQPHIATGLKGELEIEDKHNLPREKGTSR